MICHLLSNTSSMNATNVSPNPALYLRIWKWDLGRQTYLYPKSSGPRIGKIASNLMDQQDGSGLLVFQDFFPAMVEKLGSDGFMLELCSGLQLLVDGKMGVITAESLTRNASLLETEELSADEAREMVREGDLDGDGTLNHRVLCAYVQAEPWANDFGSQAG